MGESGLEKKYFTQSCQAFSINWESYRCLLASITFSIGLKFLEWDGIYDWAFFNKNEFSVNVTKFTNTFTVMQYFKFTRGLD